MAVLMGKDPNTFKAFDAAKYMDSLWARYFDQVFDMGPFNIQFLDKMMNLNADYFNWTLAGNETTRKLFVTGSLSQVANLFQDSINLDKNNSIPLSDRLRFFFYSDHDDSITMVSTAFSYDLNRYPPFAS